MKFSCFLFLVFWTINLNAQKILNVHHDIALTFLRSILMQAYQFNLKMLHKELETVRN